MAKNTKTPVMVLQELAVKKNTVPEYELVYSQQGTHDNIFHYRVTILNEQATGVGRSKKEAKHEAATNALKYLAEREIFHPDVSTEYITRKDTSHEHVQTKAPINCIPRLLDMCVENKIPVAEFFEISAVGPPHCREFTYECRISSITTRATAGSKKHAKQLAAKDMLNRIMSVIPELQEENDQLKLTENDEEIIEKYTSLSQFTPGKVNFNNKVTEYDLQFKVLMKDLGIETEKIMKLLEMPPSEDILDELLGLLQLHFELHIIQESHFAIVAITVNSDTPLTVIEMGDTLAQASKDAVSKTLIVLKELLT